MDNILRDIGYGFRTLIRTPGFTILALITLGLGIGANTAVFSIADAVLFRPLPFGEPNRIVMLWETNPHIQDGGDKLPAANADFLDWRSQNRVFEHMAAFSTFSFSLSDANPPVKLDGVLCSPGFFSVLGMEPAQGRGFTPNEEEIGKNNVVVISDALWRQQFASDPKILGKELRLTGQKYTVIGVMPPKFSFPEASTMPTWLDLPAQTEVWVPLTFDAEAAKDRSVLSLAVIARLKPGITLQQAQTDMSAIETNIDHQYRKSQGFGARVMLLRDQMVGDVRFAFLILLGAVALVLLIACSNVANLLLVRFASRNKEFALRTALGTSRHRLIRQMLTESILLALMGGILGLVLAKISIGTVLALSADLIPRSKEVSINGWVLFFAFVLSLLTGVITGLIPAFQSSRSDPNAVLKEESRGLAGGRRGRKAANLIVVLEFSLTLILLISSALLIESFRRLHQVNIGFNPNHVLTMRMALPTAKYSKGEQKSAFFQQLLQQISALPGVQSAGVTTSLPLSGTGPNTTVDIIGRPSVSLEDKPKADYFLATPKYFATLDIPLLRGRLFTEDDTSKSIPVALINEAMAKAVWPNQDPIGQQVSTALEGDKVKRQIIGIIGNVRHASLDTEPQPGIFVPYAQNSYELVFLAVRTKADPLSLASTVRNQVMAVDREQPVYDIKSMNQVIEDSSARRSLNMLLLSISALMALVLAMVGIYSVIASSITQRTYEIGVRVALGAQPGDILKLVLRQGLILVLIGMAVGVAAAFGVTQVMSSLLYKISATDPLTFLGATLILTATAMVAIYMPARKATKLKPMVALRQE